MLLACDNFIFVLML